MSELGALPPGWDTKFDPRTGRYYFINHYTKTTSWEDPRVRYQQIGKPTSNASKENKFPGSKISTISSATASVVTSDPPPAPDHAPPLQTYPIGTIPPGYHVHLPIAELSTSDLSTVTVTQSQVLQDLSNRRSVGSPVPGRSTTPQPHMGHLSLGEKKASNISASPLPLARLQLEESLNGSPMSQRSVFRRESHVLADISEVDATFSNHVSKHEEAVASISAMFPTVDEGHIKDLLKKYHNSTAVVISALQVAKHPFITPGPSSVFTPPPVRHSTLPGVAQGILAGITMTGSLPHYYNGVGGPTMTPIMGLRNSMPDGGASISSSGYPTPRPGSAASGFDTSFYMGSPQIGSHASNLFRSFPRPHSSPKMKLRYLKSVFPTVEEYLLLDVLSNSDNNVQKAADRLVKMGYVKRDTPSAPRLHARKKEEERLAEKRTPLPKPPPIKTDKEKDDLRKKMRDKYEVKYDIPERILYMALESVLYDEDQANNLIMSMIEDDLKRKKAKEAEKAKEKEKKKSPKPQRRSLEVERPSRHGSPKHEPKKVTHGKKGWSTQPKHAIKDENIPTMTKGTCTQEDKPYKSSVHSRPLGPNPQLRKGPNDDLLLTDYVTWNGPDPELRKGPSKTLAKGPSGLLNKGTVGLAKGPNIELRKGSTVMPKGSIYQLKQAETATRSR